MALTQPSRNIALGDFVYCACHGVKLVLRVLDSVLSCWNIAARRTLWLLDATPCATAAGTTCVDPDPAIAAHPPAPSR